MIKSKYRLVVCRDDWDRSDWECAYYLHLDDAVEGAEKLSMREGCPRLEIEDIDTHVTIRVFEPRPSN